MKLYWWRGPQGNFGDELSQWILQRILNRPVEWSDLNSCDALGIGSILSWPFDNAVWDKRNSRPLHVLGSGLMYPAQGLSVRPEVRLHAVRGHLTRGILESHGYRSCKVGDLGSISDQFFTDQTEKKYITSVIPHHSNIEKYAQKLKHNPAFQLIDLRTTDVEKILTQIAASELVVSESLHGLIVADALEVPNVWLRERALHRGGDFKFLDYFSTIGRSPHQWITLSDLLDPSKARATAYSDWDSVRALKKEISGWIQRFKNEITESAINIDHHSAEATEHISKIEATLK